MESANGIRPAILIMFSIMTAEIRSQIAGKEVTIVIAVPKPVRPRTIPASATAPRAIINIQPNSIVILEIFSRGAPFVVPPGIEDFSYKPRRNLSGRFFKTLYHGKKALIVLRVHARAVRWSHRLEIESFERSPYILVANAVGDENNARASVFIRPMVEGDGLVKQVLHGMYDDGPPGDID